MSHRRAVLYSIVGSILAVTCVVTARPLSAQPTWDGISDPGLPADYQLVQRLRGVQCLTGPIFVTATWNHIFGPSMCITGHVHVFAAPRPAGRWSWGLAATFLTEFTAPGLIGPAEQNIFVNLAGPLAGVSCGRQENVPTCRSWDYELPVAPWEVSPSVGDVNFNLLYTMPWDPALPYVMPGPYGDAAGGAAFTGQFSAVPEPSTYALLGTGLIGVLTVARRRRA